MEKYIIYKYACRTGETIWVFFSIHVPSVRYVSFMHTLYFLGKWSPFLKYAWKSDLIDTLDYNNPIRT